MSVHLSFGRAHLSRIELNANALQDSYKSNLCCWVTEAAFGFITPFVHFKGSKLHVYCEVPFLYVTIL